MRTWAFFDLPIPMFIFIIIHFIHIELVVVIYSDFIINVPVICPITWALELIALHKLLDCFCGAIVLP